MAYKIKYQKQAIEDAFYYIFDRLGLSAFRRCCCTRKKTMNDTKGTWIL